MVWTSWSREGGRGPQKPFDVIAHLLDLASNSLGVEVHQDEPLRRLEALIKAAGELSGTGGSQRAVLERIVELAKDVFPPSDSVSITFLGAKGLVTAASSGRCSEEVDAIQARVAEGPCVAAVQTGQAVLVADLADEPRWPSLVAEVKQLLVRSMLVLPMRHAPETRGAISLASRRRNSFSAADRETGRGFSAMAALALAAAAERERSAKAADEALRLARSADYELRSRLTVLFSAAEVVRRRMYASDAAGRKAAELLMNELVHQQQALTAALRAFHVDEPGPPPTSRPRGWGGVK
jgi:GAF domain-containing protein